jgi:hypothetical protein
METLSSVDDAEITGQAIVFSVTTLSAAFKAKPLPAIVTTVPLGPLEGDKPEITKPGCSSSDELQFESTKKKAISVIATPEILRLGLNELAFIS